MNSFCCTFGRLTGHIPGEDCEHCIREELSEGEWERTRKLENNADNTQKEDELIGTFEEKLAVPLANE